MIGLLRRRKKVIEDEEKKDQLDIYRLTEVQVQATYVTTLVKTVYNNIKTDSTIKEEDKSMVFEGAVKVICTLLRQ